VKTDTQLSIDELGTLICASSQRLPLLNVCQKVLVALETF